MRTLLSQDPTARGQLVVRFRHLYSYLSDNETFCIAYTTTRHNTQASQARARLFGRAALDVASPSVSAVAVPVVPPVLAVAAIAVPPVPAVAAVAPPVLPYVIRASPGRGLGLFAATHFKKGAIVVQYTGEIIDVMEKQTRYPEIFDPL